MKDKLYDMMNWPMIEAIVYSEESRPELVLGPTVTRDGLLIQCFIPGAKEVCVVTDSTKKRYDMECEDEAGFFAVLLPVKKMYAYTYEAVFEDGRKEVFKDPYAFETTISQEDIRALSAGVYYKPYEVLGAHIMKIDKVVGTRFAIWAPNAMRVSVVGEFNHWDGRRCPMIRRGHGIFELFVPGNLLGTGYRYEIKTKAGVVFLKNDPYTLDADEEGMSVVYDKDSYTFGDKNWVMDHIDETEHDKPLSIYKIDTGVVRSFGNDYAAAAKKLVKVLKAGKYTHVDITGISLEMNPFVPNKEVGGVDALKELVDSLHQASVGVIMNLNMVYFSKNAMEKGWFDGTSIYESADERRSRCTLADAYNYDYGRPQVRSYLIGLALYYIENFHIDGIRVDDVAAMLYLDYGKGPGEGSANIYGGKENLEAIDFLKEFCKVIRKTNPETLLIAKDTSGWPRLTGSLEDGAMGFDYKWNIDWMNELCDYVKMDPLYRRDKYNEIMNTMLYAYSNRFILPLTHANLYNELAGENDEFKFANLRLLLGYSYFMPGKKMISKNIMTCTDEKINKIYDKFVSDLNSLYEEHSSLFSGDDSSDGFEWINNFSANECIAVFRRKAECNDDLLVVVNFTPIARNNYKIGVPYSGKYKEIFNSDSQVYGGVGITNKQLKLSKKDECDGREDSIRISVPPLGITVFSCTSNE